MKIYFTKGGMVVDFEGDLLVSKRENDWLVDVEDPPHGASMVKGGVILAGEYGKKEWERLNNEYFVIRGENSETEKERS